MASSLRKLCIVTGASRGLGRACAREIGQAFGGAFDFVLVARVCAERIVHGMENRAVVRNRRSWLLFRYPARRYRLLRRESHKLAELTS